MKMRTLLSLVLVFLAAAALCGCKGGKTAETTAQPDTSSQGTQDAGTPKKGGSLVYGMTQDIVSLDPHQSTDAGTRCVVFNIYEGLVKPTTTGELEPAVAESYTISEDAKTYTFTLRSGVSFHDGSTVTVEDVKYSIERQAELLGADSAFSRAVASVETPDDKTIVVTLTEGNSEFLPNLTVGIIPKSNADPAGNPIGTGPFKYVSYTVGQNLKLARHDGYWKENGVWLDEVTFKFIANIDTAFTELQAGTIDVLNYMTADQANTLAASYAGQFNVVQGSMNLVQALFLNNAYEPLSDVRVRQALCYAIDRDAVNQFIFDGKSKILGTHMISTLSKWYESSTESVYSYNPEEAKRLLAEAGYGNGFDLEIAVPSQYTQHVDTAQIIVDQLSQVGIRATINKVEWSTWLQDVYRGRKYQATVIGFDGTLAPSDWLAKYRSDAANNLTNYNNADYDATFDQALATIDDAEKVSLYKQLQVNLAENAASVYIQEPVDLVAVNAKFAGYQFYPTAAWDVSCLYLK